MSRNPAGWTRLLARVGALALLATLALLAIGCTVVTDRQVHDQWRCEDGVCVCASGYGDCDGNESNGCETPTTTSRQHCGACGHACENGSCVAGVCQCDTGFLDCDQDPSNGCEAELASDGNHCGGCDRGCHGERCIASVCQPAALATELSYVHDLVVADGIAYWCDSDGIASLVLDGSSLPKQLHSGDDPQSLRLDHGWLFWYEAEAIRMMSVSGGSATVIVEAPYTAGIAVGGGHLYWIEGADSWLMRIGIATPGQPEQLEEGAYAGPVVGNGYVYWSTTPFVPYGSKIRRRGLAATSSELFDESGFDARQEAAFRDGVLYWAPNSYYKDALHARSETGSEPRQVIALPHKSLKSGRSVFAASGGVFVTNGDHQLIVEVPLVGGKATAARVIADYQPLWGSAGVAADDTFVYWLTATRLMRLAR